VPWRTCSRVIVCLLLLVLALGCQQAPPTRQAVATSSVMATPAGSATPIIRPTTFPRPTPWPTIEGRDETYEVNISLQLPPYILVLNPNLQLTKLDQGRYLVGWIEVLQKGSDAVLQTIPVEMNSPIVDWRAMRFRADDINFDGYLDFAIQQERGVHYWWLFDKDSRRFYTDTLTAELHDLKPDGVDIQGTRVDPQAREIHVGTLGSGFCKSTYVYQVAQDHLVLKSRWRCISVEQGCACVS
jgi:hypothetical protein